MTNPIDTLRPEVREDFESFDELVNDGYQRPMGFDKHWSALRAELLRLAECEQAAGQLAIDKAEFRQRNERAEAELAEAQNTIAAQQGTMGALKRKLALAEGELAALKAKTQWQPIETAPKDGTRILVAVKNGNWSVRTARMSSRMGIGWIVAWDGSYATARCVKPTHWMPLPPPPKGEE